MTQSVQLFQIYYATKTLPLSKPDKLHFKVCLVPQDGKLGVLPPPAQKDDWIASPPTLVLDFGSP